MKQKLPKVLGRSLGLCLGFAVASIASAADPQPPTLPPVPGAPAAKAPAKTQPTTTAPTTRETQPAPAPAPAQPTGTTGSAPAPGTAPEAVATNNPYLVPPPPPVQRPQGMQPPAPKSPTAPAPEEAPHDPGAGSDLSHSAPATLGAVVAQPGSPIAETATTTDATTADDAWAPTSSKAPASTVVIEEQPVAAAPVEPAVEEPKPEPATPRPIEPMVAGPVATAAPATAPDQYRETALRKRAPKTDDGKIPHRGFVVEGKVGTMGCFKAVCQGHNASPGVRVDGFIGGNAGGIFEFGLAGGWGNLRTGGAGQNALSLFGIDPVVLQDYLTEQMGADPEQLGLDLTQLEVKDAKASAAQFGPAIRIHFIPRGRMMAYVGTGVSYSLFRGKYETTTGNTRLDFHGLSIPMQAGLGVFLTKNVAVGAEFDYLWSRYFLAVLDHPQQHSPIPVSRIDSALGRQLNPDLPKFWTVSFSLRARF